MGRVILTGVHLTMHISCTPINITILYQGYMTVTIYTQYYIYVTVYYTYYYVATIVRLYNWGA